MTKEIATFEVKNKDVSFRVSCQNYASHLKAALKNLLRDDNDDTPVLSIYSTDQNDVVFLFDKLEFKDSVVERTAVFFENTNYPIRVIPLQKGVKLIGLDIAGHPSGAAVETTDEGSLLYGMINFHNQVGKTDFKISYQKDGVVNSLHFKTEVLSYKLDYRNDLKLIIKDIEEEYSMLSYSYLKQTYLAFKENKGQSTDLIWWQIFSQHFDKILSSIKTIINNPKRRLKSESRYERAERLRFLPSSEENEYSIFKNDIHHLYRTEEMFLSKDTVENRFLKYAVSEMYRRFSIIKEHIKYSLNVKDEDISNKLSFIEEQLLHLHSHPFFHNIGQFKGFTQDSLVMKKARGYSDIYKEWLLLQCGYELAESMNNLEVKDISDLYEIWCFIKVKNMVHKILGDQAVVKSSGKELTSGFIKKLVYGSQSEVKFYDGGIELATITYNAEVEKEDEEISSAIAETSTFTTIQRPDIVLRLSKKSDNDIVYTYLFDAKYRLGDRRIDNYDVPPQDAINQMHRYRDAIYYTGSDNGQDLKKEVIGGYVLYPGNLSREEFEDSYYHRSGKRVGIGAFPLRPGSQSIDNEGNLLIDPSSSEILLYETIQKWLKNKDRKNELLLKSIPQRGLYYSETKSERNVLLTSVLAADSPRPDIDMLKSGKATHYSMIANFPVEFDLNGIKYFVPIFKNETKTMYGYYKIDSIIPKQIRHDHISHIGIELKLSTYINTEYRTDFATFLGDYKQYVVSYEVFNSMIIDNIFEFDYK